jgi:hypothetical protein
MKLTDLKEYHVSVAGEGGVELAYADTDCLGSARVAVNRWRKRGYTVSLYRVVVEELEDV